jgi:hypothetical protein
LIIARFMQPVVGAARQWHSGRGIDRLQAGHRMRQHLKIDAALVHLAQAKRAEVVEPLFEAACPAGRAKTRSAG